MFKILTLICLGSDPAGCTPTTAVDVITGPTVSMQQCMFLGQSMIAPTSVAPTPGKEIAKIVCRPAPQETAGR